jgi:hypothetical protein
VIPKANPRYFLGISPNDPQRFLGYSKAIFGDLLDADHRHTNGVGSKLVLGQVRGSRDLGRSQLGLGAAA